MKPGFELEAWQCPTLAQGQPCTTIGAKRFHFRVRDGIGWFTLAMAARQTGVVCCFIFACKNNKHTFGKL